MRPLVPVLAALLLASIAKAGPNAGGVLVMHATALEYTSEAGSYAGLSGVACGQDGPPETQECPPYDPIGGADPCDPLAANPTSTMPAEVPHVWYIMAAFPPESCPRLKGVAFRIHYDLNRVALVAEGASDSEVAVTQPIPSDLDGASFPGNRSGMEMAFAETRTSRLQEIWWFAGYAYSEATDATFAVEELEIYGDDCFVDDSWPRVLDEIAGFGVLGLGGATGHNPSWLDAIGACCHEGADCTLTLQAGCLSPGFWQGMGTICAPNPCPGSAPPGAILAWGRNEVGECYVPPPNSAFVAAAAASYHSLGLKSDGTIVAWGGNDWGQCDVPAPNEGFAAVAAGTFHSLGLRTDGTIVAWGSDLYGQGDVPTPNEDFAAVSAGGNYSLGLKHTGSIVAWGLDDYGQCDVPAPNIDFVAVEAGGVFSLGLRADGTIVAWGSDLYGQGDVPTPNEDFAAVSAGGNHSLGLKSDGSVVAWGHNGWGQCSVPAPNAGFVAISAGATHSLGLKSDGRIVAWGENTDGQCEVPEVDVGFVAIATAGAHNLGVLSNAEPVGACCHPSGTCTLTPSADCLSPDIWQGIGTTCTPDPCVPTPVRLESWTAASLPEGLRIRWEVPLGAIGGFYRLWRDSAASLYDLEPTPEAVLASSAWITASPEGIVETLDREASRGVAVCYFLERICGDRAYVGPVEARWDPPAPAWLAGPIPFRDVVRLTPPATGSAQAEIFDPAGRLVRRLSRGGGGALLEWNGRDDAGRDAPPGVYTVRAVGAGGKARMRLVKVR